MKHFRRRSSYVLVCLGLSMFYFGCSSTPQKTTDVLGIIEGLVSPAAVQALIELKGKYKVSPRALAYVGQFADQNLNWITAEMKAVSRFAKKLNIPIDAPVSLTSAQKTQIDAIIKDAEDRWFNKYGWMRLGPKDAANEYDNENPTLFTAEYFWILSRLGYWTEERKAHYLPLLKAQILAMQLQPGLYDRYAMPRWADVKPFSHDENQGIAQLDYLFDFKLGFAKEQNEYGKKYDYVYMNSAWSAPDTFDRPITRSGGIISKAKELFIAQRYPGQIEVIRRTGGEPASTGGDLALCADFVDSLTSSCGTASSPILSYMRAEFLQGQSETLDGCIYQFKLWARSKFAKGECGITCNNAFCGMTEIYYQNPEHPTRRLAQFLPAGAW